MADPLLDPIFNKKSQTTTHPDEKPGRKPNELLVMQLVPLSTEQCQSLATALGVKDANTFVAAINQNGLDAFSERPGDLIDLAEYWKTHGRFASFAEMVEHNIDRKLKEWDAFRPDNEILSDGKTGYLRDLGSRNGTAVNGVRLTERVPVKEGDTIMFGQGEFRLTAEDGTSRSTSRPTATLAGCSR